MIRFTRVFIIIGICFLVGIFTSTFSLGQIPQSFNYQVVVRGSGGEVIADTQIGLRTSILKDGSSVCTEEFTPTTNTYGLVTIALGSVNPSAFSSIVWSVGNFTLKVEIDPAGGTNYIDMGTSKLQSVPFALISKTAENVFSGNYSDLNGKPDLSIYLTAEVDGDPTNELELPSDATTGDMSYFNGASWTRVEKPTDSNFRYTLEWDFTNNKPFWKAKLPSVVFNGKTLYVHPTDNSTGIPWYNGSYVTTNATSTTDGEVNTVIIVTSQGSGSYAAQVCADLVAYGFDDWYLPSKDELNALYQNKDEIKGFTSTYYWSSTEYDNTNAWGQDFTNGSQVSYAKYPTSRVRCVRK